MPRLLRFCVVFVGLFLTQMTAAATFTVTKVADTNDGTCDADCSFREAVAAANTAAGDDIIGFSSLFDTPQTIVLSGSEIVIAANGSLTINGPGAALLTLDGNQASRIISTGANVVASIDGITFTRGNGAGTLNTGRGGAIYNVGGTLVLTNSIVTGNTAANGGGLNNAASASPSVPATLTIDNCIVSNNTSTSSGGGMQNFSTSTVTINNSSFIGNQGGSTTGGGGGQFNGGVRITNSTFANNSAPQGAGGGFQSNGTLGTIITNVTISGNTSNTSGAGIHRGTTNVNFFIRNSIVAGNTGASDVTNSTGGIQSQGNNIIGVVGTSTGWVASDLLNMNPMLGPLGDNGGFGPTFVPQSGSPALDAGQNCVIDASCSANNAPINVDHDQRGIVRPQNGIVDIGSVEVVAMATTATISGQVLAAKGAVANAFVFLDNTSGPDYQARTNSLGYFKIDGVSTGVTYTASVSAKGHTFAPQMVMVTGDISDLNFSAASEP